MPRPQKDDYGAFYHHYISLAEGDHVYEVLENQWEEMKMFLASIPEEKADYAYAPGKWSIRVLLQHIIDAERVFAFRALWFARGANTPLPGYDENEFAVASQQNLPGLEQLKNELIALRETTVALYSSFDASSLQRTGMANESTVSVNALGFIIAGHFRHHQMMMIEKYDI